MITRGNGLPPSPALAPGLPRSAGLAFGTGAASVRVSFGLRAGKRPRPGSLPGRHARTWTFDAGGWHLGAGDVTMHGLPQQSFGRLRLTSTVGCRAHHACTSPDSSSTMQCLLLLVPHWFPWSAVHFWVALAHRPFLDELGRIMLSVVSTIVHLPIISGTRFQFWHGTRNPARRCVHPLDVYPGHLLALWPCRAMLVLQMQMTKSKNSTPGSHQRVLDASACFGINPKAGGTICSHSDCRCSSSGSDGDVLVLA